MFYLQQGLIQKLTKITQRYETTSLFVCMYAYARAFVCTLCNLIVSSLSYMVYTSLRYNK